MFTLVLLDGILDGFPKFQLFIDENDILNRLFWVFYENHGMRWLIIRGNKQFHRSLGIRGNDFNAYWAYAEMFKSRISEFFLNVHFGPIRWDRRRFF